VQAAVAAGPADLAAVPALAAVLEAYLEAPLEGDLYSWGMVEESKPGSCFSSFFRVLRGSPREKRAPIGSELPDFISDFIHSCVQQNWKKKKCSLFFFHVFNRIVPLSLLDIESASMHILIHSKYDYIAFSFGV
jgi:hypothetical protein